MKRVSIAPGAFITEVPGDKFNRCKLAIYLITPSVRESASPMALLPHVLNRRCAAIPDPMALSRLLCSLYGAELASESYTFGANRVIGLSVSGLKNQFALGGEDLEGRYLDLLCNLMFSPKLDSTGVLEASDVAIEREKQAEFIRGQLNDKRGYCIRKASRKLYRDNPLGIESHGYLEEIDALTAQELYRHYQALLQTAQIEVMLCGSGAAQATERVAAALERLPRSPQPLACAKSLPRPEKFEHFSETMDTAQDKLCILCSGAKKSDTRLDAVMRVGNSVFGALPTSRLFMNVREKESLCYYCSSSFGFFGGTLCVDSGVDHNKADYACAAILRELESLQKAPVSTDELQNARLFLRNSYSSVKDSPDAMLIWAFNERLRETWRSLEEMDSQIASVTADEIRQAMSAFVPAVEYRIAGKEGACV